MRTEDLKNWTDDRLKDEIINLCDKNFNLEWRIKQFEESERQWKCEIESLRTENERLSADNVAYSSANSMHKEHLEECEQKNKHLFEMNGKLEKENAYLEENVRSQTEKIDSLMKELEEEKGKTIVISDGMITMRADMWEALNENRELKAENKALKQHIKNMEDICDGSCFSDYEELPYGDEPEEKDALIAKLQDQHQQDCIRINDLTTTVHVMAGLYSALRKNVGMD